MTTYNIIIKNNKMQDVLIYRSKGETPNDSINNFIRDKRERILKELTPQERDITKALRKINGLFKFYIEIDKLNRKQFKLV